MSKIPSSAPPPGSFLLVLALTLGPAGQGFAQDSQASASGAGSYSSGQVLQALRVINDAELAQATLAHGNSNTKEVYNIATRIISDHEGSNDRIQALVNSGIELEDSPLSEALQSRAEETLAQLARLSDTGFDCTFLQLQQVQHQQAMEALDEVLLPAAQDPEVEVLLSVSMPMLEQHFEVAEETLQRLEACD